MNPAPPVTTTLIGPNQCEPPGGDDPTVYNTSLSGANHTHRRIGPKRTLCSSVAPDRNSLTPHDCTVTSWPFVDCTSDELIISLVDASPLTKKRRNIGNGK